MHVASRLNLGGRPLTGRDVDEVAVDRIAAGAADTLDRVHRPDLWAAIDTLDGHGMTAAAIARRIGCSNRTVHRRRLARQ